MFFLGDAFDNRAKIVVDRRVGIAVHTSDRESQKPITSIDSFDGQKAPFARSIAITNSLIHSVTTA